MNGWVNEWMSEFLILCLELNISLIINAYDGNLVLNGLDLNQYKILENKVRTINFN